jgi:hypothetical protein
MSAPHVEPLSDAPTKGERFHTLLDQFVVALLGRSIVTREPNWVAIIKIWSTVLLLGTLLRAVQWLLGVGVEWSWEHRQAISAASWFPLAAMAVAYGAGYGLYRIKYHMRYAYAWLEIVCALWIVGISAQRFAQARDESDALVSVLAVASAVYVVVRGLDNQKAAEDETKDVRWLGSIPATEHPWKRRLLSWPVMVALLTIGNALPVLLWG